MKSSKYIMMVLVAISVVGCEDNPDRRTNENKVEDSKERFIEANTPATITKPADRRNLSITMDETLELAKWGGSDIYTWEVEPKNGYVLPSENTDGEFTFHPIHTGDCKITLVDMLANTNEYDSISLDISN